MKVRPETANGLLEKNLSNSTLLQFFVLIILWASTNSANAQTPIITTFAGTGERGYYEGDNNNASSAKFQSINGIATDAEGNVYVSDFQNSCIRKIDVNGKTSIVAGIPNVGAPIPPGTGISNAGPAATTAIPPSSELAMAADGTLYFGLGSFQTGGITPAGNLFYSPSLSPSFATIEVYGDYLYRGSGGGVTVLNRHTNEVVGTITGTGSVRGIAADASGNLYFSNQEGFIAYAAAGQFTASVYVPYHIDLLVNSGDLAIDSEGNLYFVNNMGFVIKIDPATKSRRVINIPGAQSLRGLAVGPNGDIFIVDAGGCKVYKMGMPSKNANLSSLEADAGVLSPEFNPDQIDYTASVPFNTPLIKLTPTLADATARVYIRINEGSFSTVVSGMASAALPLNVGENVIDIRVNAQDATVQKNYQLTVTRKAPVQGEATIATAQPAAIRAHSAVLGGNIADDGGETITERGIEYSVVPSFEPGTGTKVPALTAEIGAYSVEVTPLNAGTTYYARAYAVNTAMTTYGQEIRFNTNTPPTVTNVELTGVAEVGRKLTGTYTYSDAEHSAENGSTYAWYRYDAATGDAGKLLIEGANAAYYVPQITDEGKFIAVEVTPNDGTDTGTAAESNLVGPIELGILPDAENRLYVKKGNVTGNGTGSSWSDALPELADALHWARERWLESTTEAGWNAENPLEIWVAEGTYVPAFSAADGELGQDGNRDNAFVLVPYVQLYGGFSGSEAHKEQRDWNVHITRLSGDLDNTNSWSSDDAYHVVVAVAQTNYPIDRHTVVDGFTITGGHGNGGHGSTITVNGHILDRNFGGGIAHLYASPTLSNLQITSNLAFNGGGVYNSSSSPWLTNVAIMGNSGGNGGGMINRSASSPRIMNSVITGNTANDGGGLFNMASAPVLVNATVAGNQANTGGAVSNNSGNATLHNSIVWGNNSGLVGSGFTITHSLVQGNPATGNGNINGDSDPGFVDAKAPGLNVTGDYRLTTSSAAVNRGNNAAYTDAGGDLAGDLDLAGDARLSGCSIDLGAYELPGQLCIAPSADHVFYVNQAVDTGGETYTGRGDSWENAVPELADVLKWARDRWGADGADADWNENTPLQVWVAEGTYKPLYNAADGEYHTSGGRDNAFVMVPFVQLYGGFLGNETALTDRDWKNNKTILSGDLDNSNSISDGDAYHVVVSVNWEGNAINELAVLDGFTVTGGNANENTAPLINGISVSRNAGGGLSSYLGNPTVSNVIFSGNNARNGGAISNYNTSSPNLKDVLIIHNSAVTGGGMFNSSNSNPALLNVEISKNEVSMQGGAIGNVNNSNPKLTNVIISDNISENQGGAIFNYSSSPELINVTVSGNSAAAAGGGLYNDGTSAAVLTNTIVWDNTVSGDPAGVSAAIHNTGPGAQPSISYSIIANSGGSGSGWNTAMGADGGHNLDGDPLFVGDPADQYGLTMSSPAINAGDNGAYTAGGGDLENDLDLSGGPRLKWGTVDIGAYEYQLPPAPMVSGPMGGTFKIGDDLVFAIDFYASVEVTGVPTLPITIGGTVKAATYTGLSEDGRIATFAYTVAEGDSDTDGPVLSGSIGLTGSSIVFGDRNLGDVPLTYSAWPLTAVKIDGVRPVLTEVSIASDNGASTAAKVGDKVTVTITASEAIEAPEVEIAGNKATVTAADGDGLEWIAEYVLTDADESGAVGFTIGGLSDVAGNTAPDVTTVSDESSVTFYKTAPVVEGVENGEYYNKDVTATFDEGAATLNGEPYVAGTEITEEGGYKLTVTDAAGNSTTVAFTIDKTYPEVSGVEDGGYYNEDVTPAFNEGTATLNGEPFTSGTAITGEGEYTLVVTDEAGNTTTVTFTVDKTDPVVTGVEDGEYYNEDVMVTFDGGTAMLNGEPYILGTPITAESGYKLVVTDEAGNVTVVTFTIDKTDPVVTGVEDGVYYNEDVTVTFDEGTATLNGEPFTSGTEIADEGGYKLTVTDAAGNSTTLAFTIDKTDPVVSGVEDGGYYNEDVTVTFDEGTATLNGQPYAAGTPITEEGGYKLTVTDAAGNSTTVAFTIDKTDPVVTGVEDNGYYNENITVTFDEGTATLNGGPYVAGTPITEEGEYELVITDASGNEVVVSFTIDKTVPVVEGILDGLQYSQDVSATFNEGMAMLNGQPYAAGTPITEEGDYELVVTDASGNGTTVSFTIDKTDPVVTGAEDGGYYNKDVMVTFDEGKATLNGQPYAAGTPITEEGEYTLLVMDAAGNETSVYFTIDKTAPIVKGVVNDRPYNPGVEIGFNEGIATLNGQPYTAGTPITIGGAYTLVVMDAAGNETTVSFLVGSVSSPPTDVVATAGNKQVSLAWEMPVGGIIPVTNYIIEYSSNDGHTWTLAEHEPSNVTRAVVIGLENNRPYQFRIAAVNAAGIGAFSPVVTQIPTEPVPDGGGNLPEPAPGETVVITDGKVEAITLEVVDEEYLRLRGDGYAMMLASLGVDGERIPISAIDAVIRLVRGVGAGVYVSGDGFEPGTVVTVYLFSVPELVGHIPVKADGTFAGTLAVPMHLEAGRHTLQANGIVAGGGDRSVSVGLLLVDDKPQNIDFGALTDRTYGDDPVTLDATATSGLPVAYTVTDREGNATDIVTVLKGNELHIHGAGEVVVTASQAGNLEYAPADPVVRTLHITKAPLTVSASDAQRAYGEANPVFELSYSGFVNGEDASSLDKVPSAATDASETSAPGSYAVTLSGGESDNYAFTYSGATLTVRKAQQVIAFDAPAEVNRDAGTVQLDVTASSGLPVSLSIDDEQVATLSGIALNVLRLGTVTITATQAGDGNHEAAEPVTVTVRVVDPASDFAVRVHPAVSPNGDGINEFLMIEGIRDFPKNRVSILNRNGTVVWEASGYDNDRVAFRGIGTGQQLLPAGTYFYIVEIDTGSGTEYRKGYFVLRY